MGIEFGVELEVLISVLKAEYLESTLFWVGSTLIKVQGSQFCSRITQCWRHNLTVKKVLIRVLEKVGKVVMPPVCGCFCCCNPLYGAIGKLVHRLWFSLGKSGKLDFVK